MLVNDEERMWKETIVPYFKALLQAFAWRYWGKSQNSSVRITGL